MSVPYFRLEGEFSSKIDLPHNVVYMPTVDREEEPRTADRAIVSISVTGIILALISISLQIVFLVDGFDIAFRATLISGICVAALGLVYNIAGIFTGKSATKSSTRFFAFLCCLNGVLALVSFPIYSVMLSGCATGTEKNICANRLPIWPILMTALTVCSLVQLIFAVIGFVFSCRPVCCRTRRPQHF